VNFEQVLQFVSGANQIPVLGFDKEATLDFYTPVHDIRRLPYALTCDMRLFLPRGAQPEELCSMLEQVILDCNGFGFMLVVIIALFLNCLRAARRSASRNCCRPMSEFNCIPCCIMKQ